MAVHTRQRELWIALFIVVLDQESKLWARATGAQREVTVIPGFRSHAREQQRHGVGFMNGTRLPFKTACLACVALRRWVALRSSCVAAVAQWLAHGVPHPWRRAGNLIDVFRGGTRRLCRRVMVRLAFLGVQRRGRGDHRRRRADDSRYAGAGDRHVSELFSSTGDGLYLRRAAGGVVPRWSRLAITRARKWKLTRTASWTSVLHTSSPRCRREVLRS